MKSILSTALLALAGVAITSSASAQTALSYSNGDLMLGFIDPNVSTSTYMLDLGSLSNFTSAGSSFTVNLGGTATGIGTDLNSLFGNWTTDGSLSWGAAGRNSAGSLLYLTDQNLSGPGSASDFTNGTSGNAGSIASKIANLGFYYAHTVGGQTTFSTANSTLGFDQSNAQLNSFASYNSFSGSGPSNPSASFGLGASILGQDPNDSSIIGTSIELEGLNPANGSGNAPTDFGTFTITNPSGVAAVVTYTPSVATPEPTSAVLLGIGVVCAGLRRRRNNA